MIKRLLGRIYRDEKGITGLETAIILIAFVVVAAVFAYTVLSAGLFSSQKGQEAVYAGLEETRSTMELRTGVSAYRLDNAGLYKSTGAASVSTETAFISRVEFIVASALGGEALDLNPSYTGNATDGISASVPDAHTTVIAVYDQNVYLTDAAWTVTFLGSDNGDFMLDSGENAKITVWFINNDVGTYKLGASGSTAFYSDDEDIGGGATQLLTTNDEFTVQVKPESGASLTIERTTPAFLDVVMDLH